MRSITIDTTVDVDADRQAVWGVLTDFAAYDQWNPFVRIEGTAKVGTKLAVHMIANGKPGLSFRPKVLAATPDHELRWLGTLGFHGIIDGEHFFVLTTNGDGSTRVNHGEHFSGVLVALVKGGSAQNSAGYEAFCQALKQRVEAISATR